MRALVACGALNIYWRGFAPSCRRFFTVKSEILLAIEHIQNCAFYPRQPAEVFDASRIYIDATDATRLCRNITNAGLTPIETGSAAAEAAEQVEVAYFFSEFHFPAPR